MNGLMGKPIDQKNIGLAKLLYELRQDLDIYCLISVNADEINKIGVGKSFFGRLKQLVLMSISLNICKIFEKEKGYELNSIRGVIRYLATDTLEISNDNRLIKFIQKYEGPSSFTDSTSALQLTIDGFEKKYNSEFEQFKSFRDKKAAHSEYDVCFDRLPSYECMESLFSFGAEFYNLISAAFIGIGPCDLMTGRKVKIGLKKLLEKLGLGTVKTNME